jgi:hypothetical protein
MFRRSIIILETHSAAVHPTCEFGQPPGQAKEPSRRSWEVSQIIARRPERIYMVEGQRITLPHRHLGGAPSAQNRWSVVTLHLVHYAKLRVMSQCIRAVWRLMCDGLGRRSTCGVLAWLAIAAPAVAEDRAPSVFGGYSFFHVNNPAGTFPVGWMASAALPLTERVDIVAAVSSQYKSYGTQLGANGDALRGHNHAIVVGPRLDYRRKRLVAFGQILFGIQASGTSSATRDAAVTRYVWEPGGGIDLRIAEKLFVRFESDYRVTVATVSTPSAVSFASGLVLVR